MGYNVIKIGCNPDLDSVTRRWIDENFSPSMTSNDGSTNQYDIDSIVNNIDEELIHQDDVKTLIDLSEEVDYIEF